MGTSLKDIPGYSPLLERANAPRIIPAASKLKLEFPEHLGLVSGNPPDIEDLLGFGSLEGA